MPGALVSEWASVFKSTRLEEQWVYSYEWLLCYNECWVSFRTKGVHVSIQILSAGWLFTGHVVNMSDSSVPTQQGHAAEKSIMSKKANSFKKNTTDPIIWLLSLTLPFTTGKKGNYVKCLSITIHAPDSDVYRWENGLRNKTSSLFTRDPQTLHKPKAICP